MLLLIKIILCFPLLCQSSTLYDFHLEVLARIFLLTQLTLRKKVCNLSLTPPLLIHAVVTARVCYEKACFYFPFFSSWKDSSCALVFLCIIKCDYYPSGVVGNFTRAVIQTLYVFAFSQNTWSQYNESKASSFVFILFFYEESFSHLPTHMFLISKEPTV